MIGYECMGGLVTELLKTGHYFNSMLVIGSFFDGIYGN